MKAELQTKYRPATPPSISPSAVEWGEWQNSLTDWTHLFICKLWPRSCKEEGAESNAQADRSCKEEHVASAETLTDAACHSQLRGVGGGEGGSPQLHSGPVH